MYRVFNGCNFSEISNTKKMKKKTILIVLALFAIVIQIDAQKYFTKSATIKFSSDAPMEKIEAINSKATSVIDLETGKMEWAVLIKAFKFEKALMEEHFNENYMESSQFPKSKFKGQITNLSEINFNKSGTYMAKLTGQLDIHGVQKSIICDAAFVVSEEGLSGSSSLEVMLSDYDISIPKLVKDNIAKTVQISIEADFKALKR